MLKKLESNQFECLTVTIIVSVSGSNKQNDFLIGCASLIFSEFVVQHPNVLWDLITFGIVGTVTQFFIFIMTATVCNHHDPAKTFLSCAVNGSFWEFHLSHSMDWRHHSVLRTYCWCILWKTRMEKWGEWRICIRYIIEQTSANYTPKCRIFIVVIIL